MSKMISLPLGKGVSKFPNLTLAKPEFQKGSEQKAGSDLEFIKTLADRGRLVFSDDNTQSTTGSFASIIPQNGETFYLLGGSWNLTLTPADDCSITLRNDGSSREIVGAITDSNEGNFYGIWNTKLDALIGNGVKAYDLLFTTAGGGPTANANIYGYLLPSETLSSRGG